MKTSNNNPITFNIVLSLLLAIGTWLPLAAQEAPGGGGATPPATTTTTTTTTTQPSGTAAAASNGTAAPSPCSAAGWRWRAWHFGRGAAAGR